MSGFNDMQPSNYKASCTKCGAICWVLQNGVGDFVCLKCINREHTQMDRSIKYNMSFDKTQDPEIAVMETCYKALSSLTDEQRKRAAQWLGDRLYADERKNADAEAIK